MDERFQINVPDLHKNGEVRKSPYHVRILREALFSISVERMPLVEYFVYFDDPDKAKQIKVKVYKTIDGRWYDKSYSEEAEVYSPEFGAPQINNEVKSAIDKYELQHEHVKDYF